MSELTIEAASGLLKTSGTGTPCERAAHGAASYGGHGSCHGVGEYLYCPVHKAVAVPVSVLDYCCAHAAWCPVAPCRSC